MNIFSELYGAYFRTAKKALSADSVSERDIMRLISENAFRDSALFIPEKLIPAKDGSSPWGLLKRNGDGSLSPVLRHRPPDIVTQLHKRWLKAKLSDPRAGLFMEDGVLEALRERLKDVEPLYDSEYFKCFDSFSDGDDYTNEDYRKNFRVILSAVKKRETVRIDFVSKTGVHSGEYLPLKIEYSRKNDKFRVYCLRADGGENGNTCIINIGRISSAIPTGRICQRDVDMEEFFLQRRCAVPVTVKVSAERNGVERFMTQFASYEKCSELDLETGSCTAQIWYDVSDETELLIQLLSFGPVLEILGPPDFREKAAERVRRQYELAACRRGRRVAAATSRYKIVGK